VLQVGDLSLNQGTREVRRGQRPIALTRTEYAILELLIRNAGRVLSRDSLIERVWGHTDIENNTLDAFMRLLRAKVEAPGEPKLLHTIRGVGFALRAGEPAP
jgi:two-component system response regulator MprA